MKKPARYANIGIFTGKNVLDNVNKRVMVTTSAGDLGINYPNAQLIINCEWPKDCSKMVKHRGWVLRAERRGGGEKALFVIVAGIGPYLGLVCWLIIDESDNATKKL